MRRIIAVTFFHIALFWNVFLELLVLEDVPARRSLRGLDLDIYSFKYRQYPLLLRLVDSFNSFVSCSLAHSRRRPCGYNPHPCTQLPPLVISTHTDLDQSPSCMSIMADKLEPVYAYVGYQVQYTEFEGPYIYEKVCSEQTGNTKARILYQQSGLATLLLRD
jgi:hypothetical protein